MVRKHDYNFCYSANVLNIRSRGFDRAQYCITDVLCLSNLVNK